MPDPICAAVVLNYNGRHLRQENHSSVVPAAQRVEGDCDVLVSDLIEDPKTGFFYNPHDSGSMRAAVEKALPNPARTVELAKLAKLQARELFHPKVIAQRHIEIYREILENGPIEHTCFGSYSRPC